jgi:hypothetical protein
LLAKQQGSGQWKKIKEGTVEEMILQKVCGITQ